MFVRVNRSYAARQTPFWGSKREAVMLCSQCTTGLASVKKEEGAVCSSPATTRRRLVELRRAHLRQLYLCHRWRGQWEMRAALYPVSRITVRLLQRCKRPGKHSTTFGPKVRKRRPFPWVKLEQFPVSWKQISAQKKSTTYIFTTFPAVSLRCDSYRKKYVGQSGSSENRSFLLSAWRKINVPTRHHFITPATSGSHTCVATFGTRSYTVGQLGSPVCGKSEAKNVGNIYCRFGKTHMCMGKVPLWALLVYQVYSQLQTAMSAPQVASQYIWLFQAAWIVQAHK